MTHFTNTTRMLILSTLDRGRKVEGEEHLYILHSQCKHFILIKDTLYDIACKGYQLWKISPVYLFLSRDGLQHIQ